MTATQFEMKALYQRLKEAGFPKGFVRKNALPDWWDEDVEKLPSAAIEAAAYISRRLNLDMAALLSEGDRPLFRQTSKLNFKSRNNTDTNKLLVAQSVASRVADMVAYAYIPEFKPLDGCSASEVRSLILERSGCVNLEGVLAFCSSCGVPVLHFKKFPSGCKKFDGMVGSFYNRPVIIVSLNSLSPAKLLFIVAHELGHIVMGHIQDGLIMDENAFPQPEENDWQEIEANEFAVELLFGDKDANYSDNRRITAEILTNQLKYLELKGIDPGAAVLNYGWHRSNSVKTTKEKNIAWGLANKALKIIEQNMGVNTPQTINQSLLNQLDLEKLDVDSQDYLKLAIEV